MLPIREVRDLLSLHGELRPQAPSLWTGEVPLPPPVAAFYQEVGPLGQGPDGLEIPTGGNPTCIPRLQQLWPLQAGYRWHGRTGERLAGWLDDWLVVACESPHPYILHTGTGKVLFALAAAGEWRPQEVFPDVLAMAAGLAAIGKAYNEVGEARWNKDFNETPEFIALKVQRLAEVLGDVRAARQFFETVECGGWR